MLRHLALRSGLLSLMACGAGAPTTVPPTKAPAAAVASTAVAAPMPAGDRLATGARVERQLPAGKTDRFVVQVPPRSVLTGVVEQRGVDVMVATLDARGKKIAEVDSPNGSEGPEPFFIESQDGGWYVVEIRRFAANPPPPTGAAAAPAPAPAPAATPPPTAPTEAPAGSYAIRIEQPITAEAWAERLAKESIESPRLFELWRDLRAQGPAASASFWRDIAGKAPLFETTDDPNTTLVTFVFRAPAATPWVGLLLGPTAREKPMRRLEQSDVWFLSARMPRDSRFAYAFLATQEAPTFSHEYWGPQRPPEPRFLGRTLDPNNAREQLGLSFVELPGVPAQTWLMQKPDVRAGKMNVATIDSRELGEKRRVGIYTPAGWEANKTYPLVIAFDGEVYGLEAETLIPLPTITDNLTAAKKIPPVVVALVDGQGKRDRDLAANPTFARFIARELVPMLRKTYRAGLRPADTLVTGSSFGGLASLYIGFQHPDVIGNALSQSGSFQFSPGDAQRDRTLSSDAGWLMRQVAAAPRKPLRVYMDAGRFETDGVFNLLASNRHMRDVLEAKGYPVKYAEFSGGHEYFNWRGTIADGLMALLSAAP